MTAADTNSWRGIQTELLRRINEREWLPGSLVPNEADLAIEFGCARATVNRAMRELADAGLLDRKRKAGTRVALNPTSRVILDIPIIRLEVEQRGAQWRYSLIESVARPASLALTSRLGLARNTEMLHVRSLHYADNRPFLHEDRWINLDLLPHVRTVDFDRINANEWLIQNAPYTAGDISFSAMSADKDLADLLDAPEGSALFAVDRITWDKDRPVTAVRLSYAPGYRMHTTI